MEEQLLPYAPTLGKTFIDIFTTPSDAYEGLTNSSPSVKLWLIPLLITLVLAITATFVVFNTDVLRTQIMEQQQKQLDKSLQEGTISQERYDQTMSGMEKMGSMFVIIGSVIAVLLILLLFFLYTLLLWLADKFILKATAGYTKHLELYGISMWIIILGTIVAIAMKIGFGSMAAGPSAAFTVMNDFDPSNKMHGLLAALNIFGLWQAAVIGFGLSKFSGKSTGISLAVSFGLWGVWAVVLILLGLSR
jgi:hypothetical protein